MNNGYQSLTEKEKQTLRMIVRGHDAKSAANLLGLSVHTVNERLRIARRKLAVTSSREAARLVLAREAEVPEKLAYKQLGGARQPASAEEPGMPNGSQSGDRGNRLPLALIFGGIIMTLVLALIAVASFSGGHENPSEPEAPTAETAELDAQREAAAASWLALVDKSDWQASYDAAGKSFHAPNTVQTWQAASEQARVPLGRMISRNAIAFEYVNAPPNGYEIVRFRTDFEKRSAVIESVTLERENGAWKVVGYLIL